MDFENATLQNTSDIYGNDTSPEEDDKWELDWQMDDYCTIYFAIPLTITTSFYGLISWILMQKWRTFKNYVFININAACFFKYLIDYITSYTFYNDYHLVLLTLYISAMFAYTLWLLVLCVLFYSTIVKIFKPPVHGRFRKSALLAWGVPTIVGIIGSINEDYGYEFVTVVTIVLPFFITFVTFVMYMIVLWSLLKRRSDIRVSNQNRSAKIQMATLLFLMSGTASVACQLVLVVDLDMATKSRGAFYLIVENADLLPSIVVSVWVFISKSNRNLWREYYRSRFRNRNNAATIDMA